MLRRLHLLRHVNLSFRRIIGNRPVEIPVLSGVGNPFPEAAEPWMLELLQRVLPFRDGAFLDVGVNEGQTLIKLRVLDPAREYWGFEPNPVCLHYVERLIAANNYQNTRLIPVALSSSDGIASLTLYSQSETDSAASVIPDFRSSSEAVSQKFVPCFSWKSVEETTRIGKLGVVKIDVEGGETEVIQTLFDKLCEDRPVVILEILPTYTAANRQRLDRQQTTLDHFARANYQMFRILKRPNGTYGGCQPLEDIGIQADINLSEYLFAPKELVADLQTALRA